MRRISFLALASLMVAVVSLQTALAQFPVKIKIPKLSQPKPQPTSTDTTQRTPDNGTQPTQPQPDDRSAAKPAQGGGGEQYPKRTLPTDAPWLAWYKPHPSRRRRAY